jgi:putative colanic acid biosynthesis acetyltransferase WcaF
VDPTSRIASAELQAPQLDVATNRAARKYSRREQALRVLWTFGRWLIILSPHPCHGWRRFVLRLFGARVGRQSRIHSSTVVVMPWNVELGDWCAVGPEVFVYSLGKIRIGQRATVSYRSHLCAGTHDFTDPTLPLLKPAVTISDDAWVGTEAFIGPGVIVGQGAIVAARAVVVKDVEPLTIVGGHPAHQIGVHPGIRKRRG